MAEDLFQGESTARLALPTTGVTTNGYTTDLTSARTAALIVSLGQPQML